MIHHNFYNIIKVHHDSGNTLSYQTCAYYHNHKYKRRKNTRRHGRGT